MWQLWTKIKLLVNGKKRSDMSQSSKTGELSDDLLSNEAKLLNRRLREIETSQSWLEEYVYENVQKVNYLARDKAKIEKKSHKNDVKRFGGKGLPP